MSKFKTHIKKRLPLTMSVLLAGVALAATLSTLIEAPQAQNDYLHDHLTKLEVNYEKVWKSSALKLPEQDRLKIAKIITRSDNPVSPYGLDNILTGQALSTSLYDVCRIEQEDCTKSIRLNRSLSEDHLNDDTRVVNVKETSVRIDFDLHSDPSKITLASIFDETRILSFYQTQAGWIQNGTKIIAKTPNLNASHDRNFAAQFSDGFVGLNYYPASASWRDFWVEFPIDEIKFDIEKAKRLNVNSLRIFLTHDYFDNIETREDALEKLQTFLDLCQENDIQVLLTLFDLRPDYALSNWNVDIAHIDYILDNLAAHKAVMGVDLKNQPDLDFENWGEGLVEAWLTVMARHIQSNYSNLVVTTGWSKAENAARLSDVFDIITYHEYQNPESFGQRLNEVIEQVGDKPVMITELGSTIWHPPFVKGYTETAQASRLQNQLSQAERADGVFVWTLNDFGHVGKEVVGPLPWRQAQQRHFGLVRPDGSLRPAAHILKSFGARSSLELTHAKIKKSSTTQN